MALLNGGNIANVERITIVTEETMAKTYTFETASSCSFTAAMSSGQEVEQRIKNTVYGLLKTDDLVKGYDIEIEDQRLIAEVMALVDGGTLTSDGDDWESYASPVAGASVNRTRFTLKLYTSDRDTDASVREYYCWTFVHCKGKPVGGSASDNAFSSMKYSIESRPANGESALTVTRVDELPVA